MSRTTLLLVVCVFAVLAATHGKAPVPAGGMPLQEDKKTVADDGDVLDVYVIPHSHDDAMWIMSFEEYYQQRVVNIYTTVTKSLLKNPKRKFNAAEVGFFHRWWIDQDESVRADVRKLVANGQLFFVEGGWVQPDEAVAYVYDRISQMTAGHDFLMREFGVRPRVAWQIDPFGTNSISPTLWAEYGFDAYVHDRINYNLKAEFRATKNLEFVWRGSRSGGARTEMMTHILDSHYSSPSGFDFEGGSPAITPDNVQQRADAWMTTINMRAGWYRTNKLFVPFGDDFRYQDAETMYSNMDALMEYVNANYPSVRMHYNLIHEYFDDLHATGVTLPLRQNGDFVPYQDDAMDVWTGYFTSQPHFKRTARQLTHVLRSAQIQHVLARAYAPTAVNQTAAWDQLNYARESAGIFTHHDTITGTSTMEVMAGAQEWAEGALGAAAKILEQSVHVLMSGAGADADHAGDGVHLLMGDDDVLHVAAGAGNATTVVVHNALAYERDEFVRVVVDTPRVRVSSVGAGGASVPSQVVPRFNSTLFELWWNADAPALGLHAYRITRVGDDDDADADAAVLAPARWVHVTADAASAPPRTVLTPRGEPADASHPVVRIANSVQELLFCARRGELLGVHSRVLRTFLPATHSYAQYATTSSGAYIFRPDGPATPLATLPSLRVVDGPLVSLVQQHYVGAPGHPITEYALLHHLTPPDHAPSMSGEPLHRGRMFAELPVHMTHHVGPLEGNRELVSRIDSALLTRGTFYTDNGLEMEARLFNPNGQEQPIASQFYPHQSMSYIEGGDARITVITRQSMAASSLREGSLELMLHRRLLQDDGRGMGEAMDDVHRITVQSAVLFTPRGDAGNAARHFVANAWQFPMDVLSYAHDASRGKVYQLSHRIPPNVHLTTLAASDPRNATSVYLRFNHLFEAGESDEWSQPVRVAPSIMFSSLAVRDVEERTLSMNNNADAARKERLQWKSVDPVGGAGSVEAAEGGSDPCVSSPNTICPIQIRSFRANLSSRLQL